MDRPTVYTQEQGRSVDFLFAQRATMIGLGKLAQAAFGSNTVVRGLAVTPNSPAALNVLVGIGEIYSTQEVDATPWGSLPADTTDLITKQGLNMAAQTISTPAPSTSGYSVAYLIEAQYQDQDTNPAVLPYYNSANPQIPLNGQGGNGAPQATERQGVCVIQAKVGIAAPTGTQVTPSVDAGWTALAVVTVANGATTVVAGNISVPPGVPQLTSLLQMMQTESTNYALDTSTTPNQITIALTPAITAYTDGMQLNFRAANNSSNAVNINAGPGNISLSGAAGALQSGEIVAGGYYTAVYQSNTGTAVLVGQGAGAEQVNPATQSKHAMQLGQAIGRLLGAPQIFTSSGTYTPSSSLVTHVIAEVQGGGGGGAGSLATNSSQVSVGGAGAAGGYCKTYLPVGTVSGTAVTVGAAGAAGASGANGGNGGNSSFGGATGGGGGGGGASGAGTSEFAGSSAFGTATGGNVINNAGASASLSFGVAVTSFPFAFAAPGANSPIGGAGGTSAAVGYGGGGGGTANSVSQSAVVGHAGAQGVVIIYEYA